MARLGAKIQSDTCSCAEMALQKPALRHTGAGTLPGKAGYKRAKRMERVYRIFGSTEKNKKRQGKGGWCDQPLLRP